MIILTHFRCSSQKNDSGDYISTALHKIELNRISFRVFIHSESSNNAKSCTNLTGMFEQSLKIGRTFKRNCDLCFNRINLS